MLILSVEKAQNTAFTPSFEAKKSQDFRKYFPPKRMRIPQKRPTRGA
jgi:hypothetical protein